MQLQSLSDSELVAFYIDDKEQCLEELINRHKQRIFTYILTRIQDFELAEDVFQDTFMKVIRTLKGGQYNEEGKFLPWVLRIAHNLVIDHFRRSKRMPTVDTSSRDFDVFDLIKDSRMNVEKQLVQDQIEEDVRKLIEELPEEQREVLVMRHYADMSFKEIAEQTGVSINTALGRMRYALINMRKLIKKYNVSLMQ